MNFQLIFIYFFFVSLWVYNYLLNLPQAFSVYFGYRTDGFDPISFCKQRCELRDWVREKQFTNLNWAWMWTSNWAFCEGKKPQRGPGALGGMRIMNLQRKECIRSGLNGKWKKEACRNTFCLFRMVLCCSIWRGG